MRLDEFEGALSRAFAHLFERRKLLLNFAHLILCGSVFVLCRALSIEAHPWARAGLLFLPFFISTGLLLAGGVISIQLYQARLEARPIQLIPFLTRSWEGVLSASYLSIPLIFLYLLLWFSLGIFHLLLEIPAIGGALGALLAFAPFLLNIASVLLCFACYMILFFATPALALGGRRRFQLIGRLFQGIAARPLASCLAGLAGLIPLLATLTVLLLSVHLTGHAYVAAGNLPLMQRALTWFFEMLPFCALLTPAITFFFNFSAEVFLVGRSARSRLDS